MALLLYVFDGYLSQRYSCQVWEEVKAEMEGFEDQFHEHRGLDFDGRRSMIVVAGRKSLTERLYMSVLNIVEDKERAYCSRSGFSMVTKVVTLPTRELSVLTKMGVIRALKCKNLKKLNICEINFHSSRIICKVRLLSFFYRHITHLVMKLKKLKLYFFT